MTRRATEIAPGVFVFHGPEKHIGDELRAHILKRDWGKVLLWGDRQKAVSLPDVRKVRRA